MLENKDFEMCVELLNNIDCTEEQNILKEKLELIIEANNVKADSESKMFDIQDKLRKIYDKQHKGE